MKGIVTYKDKVTAVQLGDRVETRLWWRKKTGRVVYVPGLSPAHADMERDGLCWVGIRLDDGGFLSTLVDPEGLFLVKTETLVARDASPFTPLRAEEDVGSDTFPSP
jgi:hypothetical protein